eukprot:TRINITY_DN3202_c0_g1_i1.p1 TRINITY_DN3202_c0_g1~~TRINITY_DN3202_c0_g1_i1.p1  ORF type:complete len:187 (-),score=2.28 TRINITY_DN3202_c0_g1_i1:491-1051(-)
MKTSEIKKLVEAFYNGETTIEEEKLLLSYFQGEDVAEELLKERDLFLDLYKSEPIDVPLHLEAKLDTLIDELAAKETVKVELKPVSKKKYILRWAGSIAAGIAILITAGIYFNKQEKETTAPIAQTIDKTIDKADEQKIKEAQEALVLLSSKFNKGMDQLALVSTNLDKTNEILNKTFNRKKDKES